MNEFWDFVCVMSRYFSLVMKNRSDVLGTYLPINFRNFFYFSSNWVYTPLYNYAGSIMKSSTVQHMIKYSGVWNDCHSIDSLLSIIPDLIRSDGKRKVNLEIHLDTIHRSAASGVCTAYWNSIHSTLLAYVYVHTYRCRSIKRTICRSKIWKR